MFGESTLHLSLQKLLIATLFAGLVFLLHCERAKADAALPPARPIFPEACILQAVADHMGLQLKPEIPVAPVHYASATTLEYFRNATRANFGDMIPNMIANMYAFATNEIFLMDDAAYYLRVQRKIDDSLAHEYTHYLQVKYQNWDVAHDVNDAAEANAVDVQTWFRETYINQPGKNPCDAGR
jgi:hypothetical protein